MVCITSSVGLTTFCRRSQRLMAMPSGRPTTSATTVQTKIIEMVFIVSLHMPKTPISSSVITVPITILSERDASQAISAMPPTTKGQGDWVSKRSEASKNSRSGSNSRSIISPCSRVKARKAPSTARRISPSASDPSEGNSFNQAM
ncbi:hypothetical protein D9M69_598160 [compost metagenome]